MAMSPRLPAAFKFLSQHPLDLLVSTQPLGGRDKVRRIRIYYGERGAYFSFEFSLLDAQYGGDRSKMLQAAIKALLTEVKSRSVLGHDFSVWFYEEAAKNLIEQEVERLIAEEHAWQRAGEKLLQIEKLVIVG
jgi:hypothetical protein